MNDRDRVIGLVGHKVAVNLTNVEASGVEIIGTLDEVRDDGIVLSELGELGPGPAMFCPWESLRRVRERPWWLRPPHEEPAPDEPQEQEFFELREVTPEDEDPETLERTRNASARDLDRVVPIAQRQTVGEITVALASFELFGEGLGVLTYRLSYDRGMFAGGIPEPQLVVRVVGSGVELPWSRGSSGSSDTEADGEVEVRDLPEAGELEVEVTRLESLAFDEQVGEEVAEDFHDGPWVFRFSV